MLISEALKRENNNFDLIRLLAATLVIISHAYAINRVDGFVEPLYKLTHLTTMAELAVKIFFFISGLVVTNSMLRSQSAIKFIQSRFLRIFPAYVVVVLITFLIIGPLVSTLNISDYFANNEPYTYLIKNLTFDTYYTLPGVFEHTKNKFGLNSVNGSLWTIPYEIIAYCMVLLAFIITKFKINPALSVLCCLIIIEPFTPIKGMLLSHSDNPAIFLLAPHFALGALLAINQSRIYINLYVPLALFLAFTLTTQIEIKQLMLGFSTCLFLLYLCTRQFTIRLKIKYDISYGMYLWAFPIQQIYSSFADLSIYESILASVTTCSIIALISFKLVENPLMQISKKINNLIKTKELATNDIKSDIQR